MKIKENMILAIGKSMRISPPLFVSDACITTSDTTIIRNWALSIFPMSNRRKKTSMADRPRRGTPEQTRARLVATAGEIFNRVGYHGTDSNRIAKEAGYATGTFYKHFKDKRESFLAVYEAWVTSEWSAIDAELSAGRSREETARRLVKLSVDFHTKWC